MSVDIYALSDGVSNFIKANTIRHKGADNRSIYKTMCSFSTLFSPTDIVNTPQKGPKLNHRTNRVNSYIQNRPPKSYRACILFINQWNFLPERPQIKP